MNNFISQNDKLKSTQILMMLIEIYGNDFFFEIKRLSVDIMANQWVNRIKEIQIKSNQIGNKESEINTIKDYCMWNILWRFFQIINVNFAVGIVNIFFVSVRRSVTKYECV